MKRPLAVGSGAAEKGPGPDVGVLAQQGTWVSDLPFLLCSSLSQRRKQLDWPAHGPTGQLCHTFVSSRLPAGDPGVLLEIDMVVLRDAIMPRRQ